VTFLRRVGLLALVATLTTGCANLWTTGEAGKDSGGAPASSSDSGGSTGSNLFSNPMMCAAAGALLAGGVGSVENKEAMAIGAVAGGLLGWWACGQQEKPLADADKDGVADKVDLCPGTAEGAKVGSDGCAVDKDTDMDGIPDAADKCAGTPKGAAVDATGCIPTADADKDGVADVNDLCPNTPAGAAVMPNGCEMDSDGDGIPDSRDRCASTPNGVKVGTDGCAVDSDGDGVSDILDRCPNTKSGAKVDAAGCEMGGGAASAPRTDSGAAAAGAAAAGAAGLALPKTAGETLVLKGVTFETASSKLKRESLGTLNDIAEQLKESGAKVEISGHTDNVGSAAVNQALSQKRAEVVMTYLTSKGVPAESLVAKGYGSQAPVTDNGSAAGRAKNRRVELKLLGQ